MIEARLLQADQRAAGPRHQHGGLDLARRLPALVVAAREVAASVMHGVHGRRRAGSGETFWQYRAFLPGEAAARIDWRRSARDDRMTVREREWEAAHTIWLWMDRSPSMGFVSSLARDPKVDRALVLGLAAADVLVRGGERVGLLGRTGALATRGIVERLAEALVGDPAADAELPLAAEPLAPRAQAILIGDFLQAPADIVETLARLSGRGAAGHLVMVADPAEETFPFDGHMELADIDSPALMRLGDARSLRADYGARLSAHRDTVREAARHVGWSFALHRTDRPASEALLALRMRLEGGR